MGRSSSRLTSTDLRCGQLPAGMSDSFAGVDWPPAAHLHVAIDDDGKRHVVQTLRPSRRTSTRVVQGSYEVVQSAVRRSWRVPVTAFWQAHRDAARI